MSECRSCGAKIEWITTPKGKKLPVNSPSITVTHPPETLVRSDGEVIQYKHADGLDLQYKYYRPHWASCPQAGEWRKKANER